MPYRPACAVFCPASIHADPVQVLTLLCFALRANDHDADSDCHSKSDPARPYYDTDNYDL